MNKNKNSGFGVGSLSLIMIFIILCLTTCTVISLTTALRNKNLSDKYAEYTNQYYKASSQVYNTITEIDTILFNTSNNKSEYISSIENLSSKQNIEITKNNNYYNITIKNHITENSELCANLIIPVSPSEERYKICSWYITADNQQYSDFPSNIWDGN